MHAYYKNFFEYIKNNFYCSLEVTATKQFQKTQSITHIPDIDISVSRNNCKIIKYFDVFSAKIFNYGVSIEDIINLG